MATSSTSALPFKHQFNTLENLLENFNVSKNSTYFKTYTYDHVNSTYHSIHEFSPLHDYMIWNSDIKGLNLLLKHGFDVNVRDSDQNTPLHVAQDTAKIRLLGENLNLNVDIQNKHDNTALEHFMHLHFFDYANHFW